MTSCSPSIVERYRDNILWFRLQLRMVRTFPFTANVGCWPMLSKKGLRLATNSDSAFRCMLFMAGIAVLVAAMPGHVLGQTPQPPSPCTALFQNVCIFDGKGSALSS